MVYLYFPAARLFFGINDICWLFPVRVYVVVCSAVYEVIADRDVFACSRVRVSSLRPYESFAVNTIVGRVSLVVMFLASLIVGFVASMIIVRSSDIVDAPSASMAFTYHTYLPSMRGRLVLPSLSVTTM